MREDLQRLPVHPAQERLLEDLGRRPVDGDPAAVQHPDPVRVRGRESLAATGADVPAGTLLATAGATVLAGAAVVLAVRRRTTES